MAVTNYFEVRNNQQTLIINDTFSNFYMTHKITGLTPIHATPDVAIPYYGIPTTAMEQAVYFYNLGEFLVYAIDTHQNKRFMAVSAPNTCVMTFRQDAGKQAVVLYPKNGTPGFSGGSFSNETARRNFWNSVCQSMKIYIFSTEPPANAANYGLVIYKENGSVLFDATRKYMRVLDCVNVTGTEVANNQNINLSSDYQAGGPQSFKSIAIMGFETPWVTTYSQQIISDYAYGICINDGIGWNMHNQLQYVNPTPQGGEVITGVFSTYHFLVIDVTGY